MINKLVEGLELEYINSSNDANKGIVVDMAVFILASFLTGLQGEKTLKLVLGDTRDYFGEAKNHYKFKCIVLFLFCRFKRESGEGFHFVAVTAKSKSDIYIGPWVRRALILKEKRNLFRSFFFVNTKGNKKFYVTTGTSISLCRMPGR